MWGGRRDGWRERTIGEYRFSSLVKFKKKEKHTLSFTSPEKDFFYIYGVITWGEKKGSANHYSLILPFRSFVACDWPESQRQIASRF